MPVVPLPNIIKNTTQAAAEMIGNLGSRQSSSRGGGAASGGGASAPPPGTGNLMQQRTNSLRGEREGSRRGQVSPAPQPPAEERYVVYIRLPFERRGFVDPPQVSTVFESKKTTGCSGGLTAEQVDWNDAKERYLWRVLSRSGRSTDLDCIAPLISPVVHWKLMIS